MERTLEVRGMLGLIQDRITAAIEAWQSEEEELFYQSLQFTVEALATLMQTRGLEKP
jgi:hypothetical protein